jgi:hypothetical protein
LRAGTGGDGALSNRSDVLKTGTAGEGERSILLIRELLNNLKKIPMRTDVRPVNIEEGHENKNFYQW